MEPKSPAKGRGTCSVGVRELARPWNRCCTNIRYVPLAGKGQEAWEGGTPTSPLCPSSAPSQERRAGKQEEGGRVG